MSLGRMWLAALGALAISGCVDPDRTEAIDGAKLVVRGHLLALADVDAPNAKHPKCKDEAKAAGFAQVRMDGLLRNGKQVDVRKKGMACFAFMTCEAVVAIDGKDLGELMVEQGYLAPKAAKGSDAKKHDWCAPEEGEPLPVMTPESPPPPEPPAALMNAPLTNRASPESLGRPEPAG